MKIKKRCLVISVLLVTHIVCSLAFESYREIVGGVLALLLHDVREKISGKHQLGEGEMIAFVSFIPIALFIEGGVLFIMALFCLIRTRARRGGAVRRSVKS